MAQHSEAPAIGIDLGTTYSCVGVWQNGRVEIITNDMGNNTTPSYVAFTSDERLIGEGALNQIATNAMQTVFDAKRLIGRKFHDPTDVEDLLHLPFSVVAGMDDKPMVRVVHKGEGRLFSAEEISSMVLVKMKEAAQTHFGPSKLVKKAVITVPAYFNDSQRQATRDAGVIAGLEVLKIVSEPTAAAVAYGLNEQVLSLPGQQTVLVFDLGGGTFDVSVLTMDEGKFDVKAVGGDTHLGGGDFDNILVDHCCSDLKRRFGKDITRDKVAMSTLRVCCEKAKRFLSLNLQTSISCNLTGIEYHSVISRAKFEELVEDLFEKCIETVKSTLNDADIGKDKVDVVLCVGGSTRIPKIQEMLRDFFGGQELCKEINPDEAVARGAAILAAQHSGSGNNAVQKMLLLDVTPLSLGVEANKDEMSVVIPRNTPVPVRMKKRFTTSHDGQTVVEFCIFQGERFLTTAKDMHCLGSFELSGIRPQPKRQPSFLVEFCIDADGILKATAKDKETGAMERVEISMHKGCLSQAEIERMVKVAEKFKAEDEEHRKRLEARNELETYAYKLRKAAKATENQETSMAIADILKHLNLV